MSNQADMDRREAAKVLSYAFVEASKWGIAMSAVVGAATLIASYRSKKFDQMMSISAKVSFPVMAGLGVWAYQHEVIMHDARNYPDRYGLDDAEPHLPVTPSKIQSMPTVVKAMNVLYDHPFEFIGYSGMAVAGSILYSQRDMTHLTMSQKIMHSRVFAQMSVISILLGTMGFREWMDRNGRFLPDPSTQAASNPSDEN